MMLLAIEVVLLFTYTSRDYFTILFYNLISFEFVDDTYKNDTPQRIAGSSHDYLTSSAYINYDWISEVSVILASGRAPIAWGAFDNVNLTQRPVLYLNNS